MNRDLLATPEEIRNNSYFQDAILWYNDLFLWAYFQRSVFCVIAAMVGFLLCVLCYSVYSQLPLQKQMRYASFIRSGQDYNADIVTDRESTDPRLAVAKFLLQHYVEIRHNYNYQALKKRIRYIQNLSSAEELNKYYAELKTSNPASLVLKYKDDYVREAHVKHITFVDQNNAHVVFESKVKNRRSQALLEHGKYIAKVAFEVDNVDAAILHSDNFHFKVTNYQVEAM